MANRTLDSCHGKERNAQSHNKSVAGTISAAWNACCFQPYFPKAGNLPARTFKPPVIRMMGEGMSQKKMFQIRNTVEYELKGSRSLQNRTIWAIQTNGRFQSSHTAQDSAKRRESSHSVRTPKQHQRIIAGTGSKNTARNTRTASEQQTSAASPAVPSCAACCHACASKHTAIAGAMTNSTPPEACDFALVFAFAAAGGAAAAAPATSLAVISPLGNSPLFLLFEPKA
mmetsp:Transcript_67438/g.133047  ORF Transcript_67438/g.133047 Transcript_67438/m.133047 type:complete len:228 (-) Transcript_67438:3-686(-)|eukprot:CAMPEP_0172805366 /NCGR_PEP_ID=MMETSP1075-20121228/5724_1 /TAXON_ID=2916 /ORGANISM="Ceratium fusus, Strain PA161109" /LENGTH=227 /DNA_ID=CAMNT_0013644047 /DNA_START=253 /DNA_END=933 /DNA_ORIENTATION=-